MRAEGGLGCVWGVDRAIDGSRGKCVRGEMTRSMAKEAKDGTEILSGGIRAEYFLMEVFLIQEA
jgi:hypothetical protein